jgi:hypothetical protein
MSGKKPFNDGYRPETHGYKPAQQPRPMDMPEQGRPGAGYQPTTSQGDQPGNPPKKP